LAALLLAGGGGGGGGDDERGYELLKQGKYKEAAQALAAAIEAKGPSAELCYNHALALWKSGQADEATTVAERAAMLSDGRLGWLRDGIVGAVQYEKAKAETDTGKALDLAKRARDTFERGALARGAGEELARNLERALALVEELEKKKEEEEKKKDEKKDDKDKDKDKDKKDQPESRPQSQPDSQKSEPESRPSSQPESQPQSQPQSQQQGDQQEPQKGDEQKDEPKQDQKDAQQKQNDAQQKPDARQEAQPQKGEAPGEQKAGELSPEQTKRLLEALDKLLDEKQKLRLLQRLQRPKVDKDW
jgi:Ca-activated chloride channel family protein